MITERVYHLCTSDKSISAELAKDPTLTPGEVSKKLFGSDSHAHAEIHPSKEPKLGEYDDLERAFQCGKWGRTRPSDLFLKVFHDVLLSIDTDPMIGMTSPSLLGSSGVLPLSIIAPLPDICRHMGNCIARAQKDVFLATNYWMDSDASTIITNSIRELNRRAGERGEKVIVKVMYDRGNPKQVLDNHQNVAPSDYSTGKIKLPHPDDVPNVDMQVVNYHRPIFGTFHSKFMVVDRKIGIVSSNNIQDNDNLEMMSHFEGPIVDSLYDVCLASWHNALKPPLPTHNTPAVTGGYPAFETENYAKMFLEQQTLQNSERSNNESASGGQVDAEGGHARTLAEVTEAGNTHDLPENTGKDPHWDVDIAGEVTRMQSVLSPRNGESRMQAVSRHLNTTIQHDTTGNAPECEPGEEMTPYIPHPSHEPFPMAMVCRKPFGAPNHSSVHVPQNEAFLSAIRNARKTVFIQTPNLNAEPLIPAILEAVRRGIDVTYYVCLGYNDAGELLPFQGGTNEMIAHKLYTSLSEAEKAHLHIYNYVAKDQTAPIHNKFKKRSCHIKLMIVDSHLGIQGNGNQDTQSYYHSQEVNVMLDSEVICKAWEEGIRRNQNTHIYGAVSKEDGCWHGADGKMAEGAIGTDPGKFAWAKGMVGAVQRVRGVGGF